MKAVPFPKKTVPKEVAIEELAILERTYPEAVTALHYTNPYELLIAVILSAQCTDARVNQTTPALFKKYPTPANLAVAKRADVEQMIKSCGFFRMKTKSITGAAQGLVEKYDGVVPSEREQLEALPGVGRKTASVVMAAAFKQAAFAVDTHVFRVAHRLGLTVGKTPRDVEDDVTKLVPPEKWGLAHHWLILHGRQICKAPTPLCERCPVNHLCPSAKFILRSKTAAGRKRRDERGEAAPRRVRSSSGRKKR